MKQGETITISGEFTGLDNLRGYTVLAMIYCQNARQGYKKIPFSTDGRANDSINGTPYNSRIEVDGLAYSFTIPSAVSANMQGECQVELGLQHQGDVAISENYANFSLQNSVLGTNL